MLYAWKRADEKEILTKLRNIGLDVDQLYKRGLLDDEFIKAAALGMVGWRGSYFREVDAGQFVHILQTYGPLWVAIDNDIGQSGHAVVIGAYVSEGNKLKIFNQYNRYEIGTVENRLVDVIAISKEDPRFPLRCAGVAVSCIYTPAHDALL
jgi:Papain-like cysteine protease AvrRpt2